MANIFEWLNEWMVFIWVLGWLYSCGVAYSQLRQQRDAHPEDILPPRWWVYANLTYKWVFFLGLKNGR